MIRIRSSKQKFFAIFSCLFLNTTQMWKTNFKHYFKEFQDVILRLNKNINL